MQCLRGRGAWTRWLSLPVVTLFAGSTAAWSGKAEFGAEVHGHEFRHVSVVADGCSIRYQLTFVAPAAQYPAGKPRTFRFAARIRFHDGLAVLTPTFTNSTAGERTYAHTFDTRGAGCWAERERRLLAVDVEGCRGRDCRPEAFD